LQSSPCFWKSLFFSFCPWINCNWTIELQHHLQNSHWFQI
jgi:hypothetical protein